MRILTSPQIEQKTIRLAHQILEHNYDAKKIIFLGINNNGYQFGKRLVSKLQKITDKEIILARVKLNPAKPMSKEISIDLEMTELKNQNIILVDDVANTGRTLFYACKPLMEVLTKKIEVAVLVDRKHKSFPIKVDYVGLSLATTMQEHIDVNLKTIKDQEVLLN